MLSGHLLQHFKKPARIYVLAEWGWENCISEKGMCNNRERCCRKLCKELNEMRNWLWVASRWYQWGCIRDASCKPEILISNCWSRNKKISFIHKFDATCKLACISKSNRLNEKGEKPVSRPIVHCVCKQSQNQIISISNLELVFMCLHFGGAVERAKC